MLKLQIDDKWAIMYDPDNNDKPMFWSRYGEHHSSFNGNNPTTAMFYALLEKAEGKPKHPSTPITAAQAISALRLVPPTTPLFTEDGRAVYTLLHRNQGMSQDKAVFIMADLK